MAVRITAAFAQAHSPQPGPAMHLYEGVMSGTAEGQQLLWAGAALTAAGTALGLARLPQHRVPQVAVLSAAFFVISSIHVPLGVTAEHLVLTGVMGLVLGWAAFPAVLVALMLQAVFFAMGGPLVLGLNAFVMAAPAVACHYLFRGLVRGRDERLVFAAGFAAGVTAIILSGLLNGAALWLAGKPFQLAGGLMAALHVPLGVVEGLVTGSVVVLLRKVRPEVLDALPLATSGETVL
jgi:cobalt/nickel transport system permease protein